MNIDREINIKALDIFDQNNNSENTALTPCTPYHVERTLPECIILLEEIFNIRDNLYELKISEIQNNFQKSELEHELETLTSKLTTIENTDTLAIFAETNQQVNNKKEHYTDLLLKIEAEIEIVEALITNTSFSDQTPGLEMVLPDECTQRAHAAWGVMGYELMSRKQIIDERRAKGETVEPLNEIEMQNPAMNSLKRALYQIRTEYKSHTLHKSRLEREQSKITTLNDNLTQEENYNTNNQSRIKADLENRSVNLVSYLNGMAEVKYDYNGRVENNLNIIHLKLEELIAKLPSLEVGLKLVYQITPKPPLNEILTPDVPPDVPLNTLDCLYSWCQKAIRSVTEIVSRDVEYDLVISLKTYLSQSSDPNSLSFNIEQSLFMNQSNIRLRAISASIISNNNETELSPFHKFTFTLPMHAPEVENYSTVIIGNVTTHSKNCKPATVSGLNIFNRDPIGRWNLSIQSLTGESQKHSLDDILITLRVASMCANNRLRCQ